MTLRVLISGAQGFVGPHLIAHLRSAEETIEIVPTSRRGGFDESLGRVEKLDVNSQSEVLDVIERTAPTHVIHLAGWSAIPVAEINPDATWHTHLFGTLNVARAIMAKAPTCTLLHVGTGQAYGATALSGVALDEHAVLAPTDTYTASKAAADLALGAMARKGLRCARLRPFNHTGPRQRENFVVPNFAFQLARIKAGLLPSTIRVGNLEVERDILDVRDIVSAYAKALFASSSLPEACILNVSSGKAYSIRDIVMRLIEFSGVSVSIESDMSRLRLGEIPRFVGDSSKARALLDWKPQYPFEETLRNVFDWASESVRRELSDGKARASSADVVGSP